MKRSLVPSLALSATFVLPLASAARAQSYNFTSFDGPSQTTAVTTTVTDLSESGVVAGFTTDSSGAFTNFTGTPGAFKTLNLPTTAFINGINSSGQVVGQMERRHLS